MVICHVCNTNNASKIAGILVLVSLTDFGNKADSSLSTALQLTTNYEEISFDMSQEECASPTDYLFGVRRTKVLWCLCRQELAIFGFH